MARKRDLETRINRAVAQRFAIEEEIQTKQRALDRAEREIDSLKNELQTVNKLLGSA
jgi:chromosome segregation ATPase